MSLLALIASSSGPGTPVGGGGVQATLPMADMDAHGAGYPLTYRFTVPDVAGLRGQWRTDGSAWVDLPSPPAGRWDGIDCARFTGTDGYVSKAFPEGQPQVYVRVVDTTGTPVGTYVGITGGYDDRLPVVFTYDDTPWSWSEWVGSSARHQEQKVWSSPGENMGTWFSQFGGNLASAAATIAAGYIEPVNHTLTHMSANDLADETAADSEYGENVRLILANLGTPPQSRGRILSTIWPFGHHNALSYWAASRSGSLTARLVQDHLAPVSAGTYTRGAWDATYGMVTQQQASVIPFPGSSTAGEIAGFDQAAGAQKVLDAVNYARTNNLQQCIVYSYRRHWTWTVGAPWPSMLATVSAMTDVWSVGYGHLALYQRTRERTTVTAA